jgi:hypothetical protein
MKIKIKIFYVLKCKMFSLAKGFSCGFDVFYGSLGISNVNDIERKDKRFNIEAYYRNESKTFWFGSLTIGTKAKHINLVQRIFYCEQIFSVLTQNFWDKAKQFDLVRQSRTFLFNPKTYRSKQKVLIWFAYYWNESKTF